MKSLTFTFILCFMQVIGFAQGIRFDRTTHQFGRIHETGGVVNTTFTFTNASDTIIQIEATYVTCGCTVPKVSQKPLQPGEQGTLKVQYDPNGRPGKFHKKIRLLAKGLKTKAEVFITGEVIPHPYPIITGNLRWKANLFNFGQLWHNQTDTLWLPVTNTGKTPITILTDQLHLPQGLHLLTSSAVLQPQADDSLGLVWNVPASDQWGFSFETFSLPIQLISGKKDSIRLQATSNIKEDFAKALLLNKKAQASITQDSLLLPATVTGESKTGRFQLTNTGNDVLFIRQIKTSCKCLKVVAESSTLVPGSSTHLRVDYTPGKRQFGKRQLVVMLTVNDPSKPQTRLTVHAEVKKKTK
ncbi:DUF1573 domain-containing protein [Microscilla marina]|uniref:Lipoprotein n=1 Tax=Microscilla marina ATCC 23134 TaxID=313606 RepID=A1ZQM1_MICM2|nr:DUF1573 domain-containing protein [Microscilla marina]EAY27393.1 conserved hypothetical protein [Microscilla marina ATCC 23134]